MLLTTSTIASQAEAFEIKRLTANELIATLPEVQNALNTLKSLDVQIEQNFKDYLKQSVLDNSEIAKQLSPNAYVLFSAETSPQFGFKGQYSTTWVALYDSVIQSALDTSKYNNSTKENFLQRVQAAQQTYSKASTDKGTKMLIALYWNLIESTWEYHDPIWNKEVFMPELQVLYQYLLRDPKKELTDLLNTNQAIYFPFMTQYGRMNSLTNEGNTGKSWNSVIGDLRNSIENISLYTNENAQKQVIKDLNSAKATISNASINVLSRQLLVAYWTHFIFPIWQYYNADFANTSLKPIIDEINNIVPPSYHL